MRGHSMRAMVALVMGLMLCEAVVGMAHQARAQQPDVDGGDDGEDVEDVENPDQDLKDAVDVHGNLVKLAPSSAIAQDEGAEPPVTDTGTGTSSTSNTNASPNKPEGDSNPEMQQSNEDADIIPDGAATSRPFLADTYQKYAPLGNSNRSYIADARQNALDHVLKGRLKKEYDRGVGLLSKTDVLDLTKAHVETEDEVAANRLLDRLERRSGAFGMSRMPIGAHPDTDSTHGSDNQPTAFRLEGVYGPSHARTLTPEQLSVSSTPVCNSLQLFPYSGGWGSCDAEGDTRPNTCPDCVQCQPPCISFHDCCLGGRWHHCQLVFQCAPKTHPPPSVLPPPAPPPSPYRTHPLIPWSGRPPAWSSSSTPPHPLPMPSYHGLPSVVNSITNSLQVPDSDHVSGTPDLSLPPATASVWGMGGAKMQACASSLCDKELGCCVPNDVCSTAACPDGHHHIPHAAAVVCDTHPCSIPQCCVACDYGQVQPSLLHPMHDFAGAAGNTWSGPSFTADQVRQHVLLGMSGEQWSSQPELDELHNVEAHSTAHVISVPGADLGGFLRALSIFERLGGGGLGKDGYSGMLDDAKVEQLMSSYLLSAPKKTFAVEINQRALDNICRSIHFCHPQQRLDNPAPHLISRVVAALLHPDNQGCTYFTNLIRYPSRRHMDMRVDLTRSAIKAFFYLLWGAPQHRVLSAEDLNSIQRRLKVIVPLGHQPVSTLLQVRTDQCDRYVPRLTPSIGETSIALYYVDVSRSYHAHLAKWLARYAQTLQAADLRSYDADRMHKFMNELETQQLIASLTLDAGNTTMFTVDIPPSCCS